MTDRPWPRGTATGLGSLPGSDPDEAVRLVLGEVPELPYLPELPDRGIGADMVGRAGAMLVDLPLEWQLHGWTASDHTGRDMSRAGDLLKRDLDALTEQAQGLPLLKVQVCGPMTMAANVELPNLHKVLTDHGAFRDLAGSLAEGTRLHLSDLRSRLPGTRIVLQVDEPALPSVLAGTVPTPSGYGTVRSMSPAIAQPALAALLEAADVGHRVLHCCAADVPFELIRDAGASAIAVDYALLSMKQLDSIGELIEADVSVWLGIAPSTDAEISFDQLRNKVASLWQRLGFASESLADAVVVTPQCGLAGASAPYVRRVMNILRDVGRSLTEQ
ncbi:methionine synthase [Jatrophihabitans sp. DSM 45814]